jgi:thiol-disulfide isomerase/thioredoxin
MNWKVVLLAVVVVAILSSIVMRKFGRLQGFQNPGSGDSFTMYYADWCSHCQAAKPEFSELMKKGDVVVGERRCKIRMIQPEESPAEAKGKPIKGFPTFLLETADGEITEYKGERNTQGYLEFINQQLGLKKGSF